MIVRTLVVDDEEISRRGLVALLERQPWIQVVGQASGGIQARREIDRLRPHLTFLDIRMPGVPGINVLKGTDWQPKVVYTTAFQEHAAGAFEQGALDYLVKPFSSTRLDKALERVKREFGITDDHSDGKTDEENLEPEHVDRLFVRRNGEILPVSVDEVIRLEACGDYVAMFTKRGRHLLHMTLASLENRLDPNRFIRVHRSHIVNLNFTVSFRTFDSTRLEVQMIDGTSVVASRSQSKRLRKKAI
jgi:two-component system LytT family response regulator